MHSSGKFRKLINKENLLLNGSVGVRRVQFYSKKGLINLLRCDYLED